MVDDIRHAPVLTWRGIPLVPTDKLSVTDNGQGGTSNILLVRIGQKKQGIRRPLPTRPPR